MSGMHSSLEDAEEVETGDLDLSGDNESGLDGEGAEMTAETPSHGSMEDAGGVLILTRDALVKLIRNKSDDVELKIQDKARSEIWKKFRRVHYRGAKTAFVACVNCKCVYKQDRKLGTSNLQAHRCSRTAVAVSSMASTQNITPFVKKVIPLRWKQEMTELMAEWCSGDYRPFSLVDDDGLQKVAKLLLKIGHKFGPSVDLKDIFPSASTVSTYVEKTATKLKEELTVKLNEIPGPKSFTTDHWKCSTTGGDFQTTTIHYIEPQPNGDWLLTERILGCPPMEENKNNVNIRNKAKEVLSEFDIDFPSSCWVTDNAAPMILAFNPHVRWLGCAAHDMNLAVDFAFKAVATKATEENRESPIVKLVENIKSFVSFCKRTKIQRELVSKNLGLKQEVVTRWNSKLSMLKSVKAAIPELTNFPLSAQHKTILVNAEGDGCLLDQLVRILEPMETATKLFSQAKVPTVHLKSAMKIKMLFDLELEIQKFSNMDADADALNLQDVLIEEDMADLLLFVTSLSNGIQQKLHIKDTHRAATLLHNKFKKIQEDALTKDEFEALKSFIKDDLVQKLTGHLESHPNPQNSQNLIEGPADPKRARVVEGGEGATAHRSLEDLVFGQLIIPAGQGAGLDGIDEELDAYLAEGVSSNDVLTYWSRNTLYPKLREVALYLFAIPVSSVSSERMGSSLNLTLQKRRTSLDSEKVADLLFVKSNMDLKDRANRA